MVFIRNCPPRATSAVARLSVRYCPSMASAGNVTLQGAGDLDRHNRYLIVRRLAPGNWAAGGNQVRAPSEDESKIPQNQYDRGGLSEYPSSPVVPDARKIVYKTCEAENEENRERDEEPVPERRQAVPVLSRTKCLKSQETHTARRDICGRGETRSITRQIHRSLCPAP